MDEQTENIIFSALTLNTEIATQDYDLEQERRGSTLLRTSVGSLQLILLFSDTSLTIDQIQSMTGLHLTVIAKIQQIQKDLQWQCLKLKRSYFKAKSFNLKKNDPSLNLQANSMETFKESQIFNNQQKTEGKEIQASLQETTCHSTVQQHQNEIRNMITNQSQTFESSAQNQYQLLDENKTQQANLDFTQQHSLPLIQKSFSQPITIFINQKNCEDQETQKEKQELSDEEGFLSIKTSKSLQIKNSKTQKQMQQSTRTNQKKSNLENIKTIKKIGRKRLRKENVENQELICEFQNQNDNDNENNDKLALYNEIAIEIKSCNKKNFEKKNKLNLEIQNHFKEQKEQINIDQVSNSVSESSQNDQGFKIQKKQKIEYPQNLKNDFQKKQQEKDQEDTFDQNSNPQEKSDQAKQNIRKQKNEQNNKEIKNGVSKKSIQKKNECFQSQKDQGFSLINESYKGTISSQSKQQNDKLIQSSRQKEEAQNQKTTKQGYIRLKRNRKIQENERRSFEKSKQASGKDKFSSKVQLENEESISCCIMKKRKKNQFGDQEQGNNDFQAEGIKQEIYKNKNSSIKNAKSLSNCQGKQAQDNTDINQTVKQEQLPKRNQTKLKVERANPRQLQNFLGHIDINSLNPKIQKSIRSSQK